MKGGEKTSEAENVAQPALKSQIHRYTNSNTYQSTQIQPAKSQIHSYTNSNTGQSRMREGVKRVQPRMQFRLLKHKCRQMSLKRKTLVMLTCRFLRHLRSTTFAQSDTKRVKIDNICTKRTKKGKR